MKYLIEFFIRQNTLVNILTLAVLGLGIYSGLYIKRESFPNIDFGAIQILTTYPGASSETVEQLITTPLEQRLNAIDGIKEMSSVSAGSTSVIGLELDADITTSDELKSDVQNVVDSFSELPDGSQDPVVIAIESRLFPVITIALSGNEQITEEQLRRTAKSLEAPINTLPDVAQVQYQGLRDYEILVEAKSSQLKKWDVSLSELITSIRQNNINIPGGTVWHDGQQEEVLIRTASELSTAKDVEQIVVRANTLGKPVYIKDVAKVEQGFAKRKFYLRTNGHLSIKLQILKKESGDIIRLVEDIKQLMQSPKVSLPPGVSYEFLDDASYFVKRRLAVLTDNLILGLILVLLILSIALPLRVALISAFGIPFAFLAAIAAMHYLDISINVITMLGLILVLGMLVDDAIAVTENIYRHIEKGFPPLQAAVIGTQEIYPALLTSVMTTMMAFVPLMLMGGTLGKFVLYIPYGVLLGLAASLFECFFILPNHMSHWVGTPKKSSNKKFSRNQLWQNYIAPGYGRIVHYVLKFRYGMVFIFIALIIATGMLYAKKMSFVMFPKGFIDQFSIRLEGHPSVSLEQMQQWVIQIENAVTTLPEAELRNFRSKVGGQERGNRRSVSGSHYGQVTVYLTEGRTRERSADDIISYLREKIHPIEGVVYRFSQAHAGPPRGKPVQIGVRGESYEDILQAVQKLKDLLQNEPGVTDIEDTFRPGKTEVQIDINPYQAAAAGLTVAQIGRTVRASFEGIEATYIRTLQEEIPIRVVLDSHERNSLKTLQALKVPNTRGQNIPLIRVAKFSEKKSIAAYEHEDSQRQVLVRAELNFRENTPIQVANSIKRQLKPIQQAHPQLTFVLGGESEETREDNLRLMHSAIMTFIGIFLLLLLLFKNILQPLVISLTIPLAIMPIIWAFYLHGMNLSFLAAVGMVALAGVIVNHSIVLTDFMNRLHRDGISTRDSIIEAAQMRLRPIFLASITTVSGIVPTAYGLGGLDPFVVPMAMALSWGLGIGSILVCMIYPAFLGILMDVERIIQFALRVFRKRQKHLS